MTGCVTSYVTAMSLCHFVALQFKKKNMVHYSLIVCSFLACLSLIHQFCCFALLGLRPDLSLRVRNKQLLTFRHTKQGDSHHDRKTTQKDPNREILLRKRSSNM